MLPNCEVNSISVQEAEKLPVRWVRTPQDLDDMIEHLALCQVVALDTEFIKRDTYYPRLALIQINTGKSIYLVDAPNIDLSNLWDILAKLPVMVWHSCGEDLSIFYLLSGLPPLTNIFDTQIALAYIKGQLQIGYQLALKSVLNVEVDKGQSQSDWLARPLTKEQENYAVDDVRYLLPLYYKLVDKLTVNSLIDLVWEDCQVFADEVYDLYQADDEDQYLSAVDFRHNGKQRYFLKELMIWREKLARATNQPRTFILRKQGIRELVETMPRTIKQLKQQTSIHRKIIDSYGNEILRMLEMARKAKIEDYPPEVAGSGYRSKNKTLQKTMKNLILTYSQEVNISENMIMKKKWHSALLEMVAMSPDKDESYYSKENLPKGLRGWRYDWIISVYIPFLKNNKRELGL